MRCLLLERRQQAGTSLRTTRTRLIPLDVKDWSWHFSTGSIGPNTAPRPSGVSSVIPQTTPDFAPFVAEHSPRPNLSTRIFFIADRQPPLAVRRAQTTDLFDLQPRIWTRVSYQ